VIHTVGPIKGRWGERDGEMLASCYRNSLALAIVHEVKRIAFPSISTGAYSYPREEAARVSSTAIRSFLLEDMTLAEVRLVFFSPSDARVFVRHQKFTP
jgi:O-acetyl-ADP-ribose deacetylase (regulator of RNase III)